MNIDNILDDNTSSGSSSLVISDDIRAYLAESAKWGKFIAIVGFIFMGLGAVALLIGGSSIMMMGGAGAGAGAGIMIVYVLFFLLYLVPLYYMYQWAKNTQIALNTDNQPALREAFSNHKSLYKFSGIFLAVILGIYAIMLVAGLLFGLGSAL